MCVVGVVADELRIVKDGKYGNENRNGEWDGMVGELVRRVRKQKTNEEEKADENGCGYIYRKQI
jgi:hypothetical protein